MKIVLDTRWVFPQLSGIGHYTTELVQALAELAPPAEFILLCDRVEVRDRLLALPAVAANPRFQAADFPDGPFAPGAQWRLPRWLRRTRPAVYHAPNYLLPFLAFPRWRRGPTACVVTVHDLIPLQFRDHAPRARKNRLFFLFQWLMREMTARADLLISPSTASQDAIRQLLPSRNGAPPVRVIPEGVPPAYRPAPRRARPYPELLYVGRFDPYKGVPTLIEALALVRQAVPNARLRLVGAEDPRYPEARQTAARLGLTAAIQWVGYTSDDALLDAYQQADVLVLPSRCEGFGLPVIEAMACGTPVVCSAGGSLPELADDAALLCPFGDAAALAAQLIRVLENPALAADLRARGLRRAAAFTWRRTAEQTWAAYQEAATR
ncbi:MAG: glycosyltransferase family 4 protein [Candidatus Marinimicrobia bacterium]|nr:glycosyltransferase family 4 protein [Candidatus Neomarinimicrobiota bacterium]